MNINICVLASALLVAAFQCFGQPVITAQPANEFVDAASVARFSVVASGTTPLSYQWFFDGAARANATSSALSLANAQPTNSGNYWVVVSNITGSVTSHVAELKVFAFAPHNLSGIQAQSDGSISLSFSGETPAFLAPYYDLYPLAASSNLVDWTPLVMLQRTNTALDTLTYRDTTLSQFNQRFYRTPMNHFVTPDPQPTGPCSVGTFSMLLTNVNRGNAKFMVTFWYPAEAKAGVLPTEYVEPEVAYFGGYGAFFNPVALFSSHSLPNAPFATNIAARPVVLYDPGFGGHRRENTDKTEDLASWGYVVVGLDASDTSVSVWPGGEVEFENAALNNIESDVADIEGRLLDLRFVLDELERLNASDPRLGGRLDLKKIGAFGWSQGGVSTAQLCLRDSRCKAGVDLDATYIETNVQTQPMTVPWLYFRSDLDADPAGWWFALPEGRSDDRLQVYNEQVTNAYWVKLISSIHASFGDDDLVVDPATLQSQYATPTHGQILASGRVSQIVRAYLLSFFNKFLQGEDNHLLDGPSPAYPEVMQFLSKSGASLPPEYPSAGLARGSDGSFYGTTAYGGASDEGTVFQVTTNGILTTLVSFDGTNGSYPAAGLLQASDGNFYGTTQYGGTNRNNGTVFQISSAGMLKTLTSFNGTNGSHPAAALVQGADGDFYGTTVGGGASGMGTIFKITSAGGLTTLVSFNNTNGAVPLASLAQGSNGNFYGTTFQGGDLSVGGLFGNSGGGTIFEITPSGVLTTLFKFTGSNGENPAGGLVQGANGSFYGTTSIGGNLNLNVGLGFGTVFKMTPTGVLTKLVSFNGSNGNFCLGGLMQGGDGNFYGTTAGGGGGGAGIIFQMTSAGGQTTLAAFHGPDGIGPLASLVEDGAGNFYGTTEYGGAGAGGTVFQISPDGIVKTLVSFGGQTNRP
ncbi:MAG TPA: choice-of-anchor tandem repeat GloVer-containing protein [Verrucomicrobiae bacterium]|jgi:uncharacterized repeat protein (TIGR03803 family)